MNAKTKPALLPESPTPQAAVEAAITAHCLLALAKVEQSERVLVRARESARLTRDTANGQKHKLQRARDAYVEGYRTWVVNGTGTVAPPPLTDADAEQALTRAEAQADAAARALASLEASHADLLAAVPVADRAIEMVIDAVLVAELEPEIDRALQLEQEAARIRYRAAALGLERDRAGRPVLPDAVARKLNMPLDHRMSYRPAIYAEELGANGPHKPLIAAEQELLRERIAALRAGSAN